MSSPSNHLQLEFSDLSILNAKPIYFKLGRLKIGHRQLNSIAVCRRWLLAVWIMLLPEKVLRSYGKRGKTQPKMVKLKINQGQK